MQDWKKQRLLLSRNRRIVALVYSQKYVVLRFAMTMDILDIFGREIRKAKASEVAEVKDFMHAG